MSKRREARGPNQRQLRVGEEIRHLLAQVLERGELRDPDLLGKPMTITEVRATPDMKHATIFFMPLGGVDNEKAVAAMGRARSFLRHQIAKGLSMKYVPDLHFRLDETFDEASHINELLHSPQVAADIARVSDEDLDEDSDQESQG